MKSNCVRKSVIKSFAACSLAVTALVSQPAFAEPDLNGIWHIKYQDKVYDLDFKTSGTSVSARYVGINNSSTFTGRYFPGSGTLTLTQKDHDYSATYTARVENDHKFYGTWTDSSNREVNFSLYK